MTEVAALEEDRNTLTRRLGYCIAAPVWLSWLAAHSPVHMDTDYSWASIEDWTRLFQVKDVYCTVVVKRRRHLSWLVLCISVPLSPFLFPLWQRRVANGAVHYSSRVVVILEYHSSEVTISQSTAALLMSTSLFPDKTVVACVYNTMDIDLIVFLCVCMCMYLLCSLFSLPFPTWGYSMMIRFDL